MPGKLVSVIMPVHNGERYLREAVDGVLGQTHADLELLVVENACTDDTAAILDSYRDPRLRRISEPRIGVSHAQNAGLEAARGDVVTFFGADDVMYPERLRLGLALMRSGIDLVTCDALTLNAAGMPVATSRYRCLPPELVPHFILRHATMAMIASYLIRRRALKGLRFDPELSIGEDGDLLGAMALLPRAHIALALWGYRRHGGSATDRTAPQRVAQDNERLTQRLLGRYAWSQLVPYVAADLALGQSAPAVADAFIGFYLAERKIPHTAIARLQACAHDEHALAIARVLIAACNGQAPAAVGPAQLLCERYDTATDHFTLSICLAKSGRYEEAWREATEVLRRCPGHTEAIRLLEDLGDAQAGAVAPSPAAARG